jgi:uncharacterized protein
MGAAGAAVMRTCIGCRRVGPAAEMARLRIVDGQLAVGPGSGRGASLHRQAACLSAALRPGVFGRAFKRQVSPLPGEAALAQLIGLED